jgi:hypothetical protein
MAKLHVSNKAFVEFLPLIVSIVRVRRHTQRVSANWTLRVSDTSINNKPHDWLHRPQDVTNADRGM